MDSWNEAVEQVLEELCVYDTELGIRELLTPLYQQAIERAEKAEEKRDYYKSLLPDTKTDNICQSCEYHGKKGLEAELARRVKDDK